MKRIIISIFVCLFLLSASILSMGQSKVIKENERNPQTAPLDYMPGTYLVHYQWGQHGYYKGLCPNYIDLNDDPPAIKTCRLGCWSTALAQILKYYEIDSSGSVSYSCSHSLWPPPLLVWPSDINNNVGAHDYKWWLMPYNLTSSSSSDEIEETRQFCFDVACVIQKDFGTGRYKTLGDDFDTGTLMYELEDHFDDIDNLIWVDELKRSHIEWQIDHFRPIMFYIRSTGERGTKEHHAVVLDGYREIDGTFEVHLNYGWDAGNPDPLYYSWYAYNEPFPEYDDTTFRKGMIIIADPPPQLLQIAKAGLSAIQYTFQAKSTNKSRPTVYYKFDWDDGTTSDWMGRYKPGEVCNATHSWKENGIYSVKVKASDMTGWESDWSKPRLFYIPKNHRMLSIVEGMLNLIDRFPRLESMLLPIVERLCS